MNIEGFSLFVAVVGMFSGWRFVPVLIYLGVKMRLVKWSWNATLATMLTAALFATIAGLFYARAQGDGNKAVMLFCALAFGYLMGAILALGYATIRGLRTR
jgi:hypothetical protein